jgi:hypothetical protein
MELMAKLCSGDQGGRGVQSGMYRLFGRAGGE